MGEHERKELDRMIKPRTIVRDDEEPKRPTFGLPKPDSNFGGWGPRLRA